MVYDSRRQRQSYLIEFSLPSDTPMIDEVTTITENHSSLREFFAQASIIESQSNAKESNLPASANWENQNSLNMEPPKTSNQPAGLMGSGGNALPLHAVHVRAHILDMVSQVTLFQHYVNHGEYPIEAKYVFPLDEFAVVCGFEAFINVS